MSLDVCTMGRTPKQMTVATSSNVDEFAADIANLTSIPATCQRWLVNGAELSFSNISTLADTSLSSGDTITVLHRGFGLLEPLPETFLLELTTVRMHGKTRSTCSRLFPMVFKLQGNLTSGKLRVEEWRKDDHDELVFDVQAGTVWSHVENYTSGPQERTSNLDGVDPLDSLIKDWKELPTPGEQFWRPAAAIEIEYTDIDDGPTALEESDKPQERPNYRALPGWFIAPSEDCFEIKVDVPVPGRHQQICRLLVDRRGAPLRAAVRGCKFGCRHEDIEEFSVNLEPDDASQ